MVFIQPWDKESRRILQGLTRFHRIETSNSRIANVFGSKYSDVVGEYFDISRTRYRKKENKTIFSRSENSIIVPKKGKYYFFKI